MSRKLSPFAAIPPAEVAGLAANALLAKRWGVLREIMSMSGRVANMNRELATRRRLLAVATAATPVPVPRREPDSEAAAA
jgi:hypothetical protein